MNFEARRYRKNTRTTVWPDIRATLKILDPYSDKRKVLTIQGRVNDLGGAGMFLLTGQMVPIPAKADITIDFDSGNSPDLVITAKGETVRRTSQGVGLRFSSIDMSALQRCILARMNR
ncbi:MAG: PilZ domain-containing protein [Desulfobacterales bacterium]|nr:PilZ domain-containing protein [Desulfobacterales bacterium]